nr:unnamed protein product [Digitaria exilis]
MAGRRRRAGGRAGDDERVRWRRVTACRSSAESSSGLELLHGRRLLELRGLELLLELTVEEDSCSISSRSHFFLAAVASPALELRPLSPSSAALSLRWLG